MKSSDLTQLIQSEIPLTQAMKINVKSCDDQGVFISAPLDANSNHKGTAFGGSVYSLMVLSGWSWLLVQLKKDGFDPEIVIASSEANYLLPLDKEFTASCSGVQASDWEKFLKTLKRKKRARIYLQSRIMKQGREAATLKAGFVAAI